MSLEEWAQSLRIGQDGKLADFAGEILDLLANVDRLEFLEGMAEDLARCAPTDTREDRLAEWAIDRDCLLSELEDTLDKKGYPGEADKALQDVLNKLDDLETENAILKAELTPEYDL